MSIESAWTFKQVWTNADNAVLHDFSSCFVTSVAERQIIDQPYFRPEQTAEVMYLKKYNFHFLAFNNNKLSICSASFNIAQNFSSLH